MPPELNKAQQIQFAYFEGILPKGPYLPCVSMAGRALLVGYLRFDRTQCIVLKCLTHWVRVTHICISDLTITGWDNDLLPGWHQAIIWIYVGILLIGQFGKKKRLWNFNQIYAFSFKKMHYKMSYGKWCLIVSASMCWVKCVILIISMKFTKDETY